MKKRKGDGKNKQQPTTTMDSAIAKMILENCRSARGEMKVVNLTNNAGGDTQKNTQRKLDVTNRRESPVGRRSEKNGIMWWTNNILAPKSLTVSPTPRLFSYKLRS